MILCDVWIDADNVSADAFTVLKVKLDYLTIKRNHVVRIQSVSNA
ncbi:MAG: hypothetical protein ACRET3_06095 [Burkholderiales bacterium]